MLQQILKPFAFKQTVDFWLNEFGSTLTTTRPVARIVKRQVEAKNTVSLWLKPNKHFVGFKAGQHLNITVCVDGVNLTRSYSVSNAPNQQGLLRLTIKKEVQGKVSTYLCHQAQVGDVIEISQAFGELQLHANQPYVLLAAGSGITPLMSLLATATTQPIVLMYWAKTREELCFLAELKALVAHFSHISLHIFLTQSADLLQGEQAGRLTQQSLLNVLPNIKQYHAVACGGMGFIESVQSIVKPLAQSLQTEAFSPIKTTAPTTALGTVRVELSQSKKVLELNQSQSLLDALEAQGIYPASGCRMGICHSCSCQKTSGTTQDTQTGELAIESNSAVRLCVSRAYSDLVLDI